MRRQLPLPAVLTVVWIVIILALVLKLIAVFTAPMHLDGNYYLNAAVNYLQHGGLTPYMWRIEPDSNIIVGSGTGYGVLILIYWLKIFGITPLSGTIFAYLVSILTLYVLYWVVRPLWNHQAALFAVMFLVVNTAVFRNANPRMDALGSLAYCLLLWAHVRVRNRPEWWLHVLMGIAVIAAMEIHLQATAYVGAISFFYGVNLLRDRKLTPAIYYGAGAILAGLVYVVVHVLPNPQAYFLIPSTCNICVPRGPIAEGLRYTAAFVYSPFEAVMTVFAVISAFRNRLDADRYFLLMLLGTLLAMAVFNPPPIYMQYFWHIAPIAAIGFGALLSREVNRQTWSPLVVAALFGCCLIVVVNFAVRETWDKRYDPNDPRLVYVRENIPTDTVIASPPSMYYVMMEYPNYLSYQSGESYGILLRGEDYTTFWEREHPRVVIGDGSLPEDSPELWAYIQTHAFQEAFPGVWVEPGL